VGQIAALPGCESETEIEGYFSKKNSLEGRGGIYLGGKNKMGGKNPSCQRHLSLALQVSWGEEEMEESPQVWREEGHRDPPCTFTNRRWENVEFKQELLGEINAWRKKRRCQAGELDKEEDFKKKRDS